MHSILYASAESAKEIAMTIELSEKARGLLTGKNFANVATVRKDGSPQVTPIWVDFDGTHIIMNSEVKRAKVKNLKRDPRVAVSVFDQENPYVYVQISGRVVEITEKGGAEGIDHMAQKYMGQEKYPWNQPGDIRVVIRIEAEKITGQG
jgi:PPOX class probable F420-dependent enzyme